MRTAILGGMGAAQVPYWLFSEELASGRVTRILRRYEPGSIPITAVRPANRRLATKVSVFIDFRGGSAGKVVAVDRFQNGMDAMRPLGLIGGGSPS
jgi:DNA-binding transcriptional LysR family regulator